MIRSRISHLRPLSLAVVMAVVLDTTGAMHVYGLADAKGESRELLSAFLLLGIALLWLLLPSGTATRDQEEPAWLGFLPPLAAAVSISDVLSFVSAGWTPARLLVLGGGTLVLFALALSGRYAGWAAALAVLLGVAIRALHIRHVPIEPARGDMLPLVQRALDNLFRGASPYTTYHMPWELPLTYLPLTWLAYTPAYLAGIDLRWTNIVAELAVLAAGLFVAGHAAEQRRRAMGTTALFWSALFLAPTVVHWDTVATAPIGWAALAWSLALVATSHWRAAVVALGFAAATTPLVAVLVPLVAVCWWRTLGPWPAMRHAVLAAAVAAILLLPWVLWAPGPFVEGNLRWFNDLDRFPRMKWQSEQTWLQITGFSGWFWQRGLENWLKPAQVGCLALVTLLYAAGGAAPAAMHRYAAAAFLLFVLFNPVLWPYLYHPALVAALLAVAGDSSLQALRVAGRTFVRQAAPEAGNRQVYPGATKSFEI